MQNRVPESPPSGAGTVRDESDDPIAEVVQLVGRWRREGGLAVFGVSALSLLLLIPKWWSWTGPINRLTAGAFVTPDSAWAVVVAGGLGVLIGLNFVGGKALTKLMWLAGICALGSIVTDFTEPPSDLLTNGGTDVPVQGLWPLYLTGICMGALMLGFIILGTGAVMTQRPSEVGAPGPVKLPARPTIEKTCPDCAEKVKSAANVCRFCGHRFNVT